MAFDNAVDYRQPQAGTFANRFGGEKGIENIAHGLAIHAMAGIADRNAHIPSRLKLRHELAGLGVECERGGADFQPTAAGAHGVRRVCAQVHKNLVVLGGIGHYRRQPRFDMGLNIDGGRQRGT